jgi:hypothetical protein
MKKRGQDTYAEPVSSYFGQVQGQKVDVQPRLYHLSNADLVNTQSYLENLRGQLNVQMPIKNKAAFGQVKIRTKKGAQAEKDLATST